MHLATIIADMIKDVQPGRYVVAVSGGVDSMVLLDLLAARPDVDLVVAHFDHGIRPDSHEDRKLVQQVARAHGLPFVYDEGKLGPGASEAVARRARYDFLHAVRRTTNARAVLTAHHQNDVLETAVLNLLRGTHRTGLTALKSTDVVKRPLLHVPKKHLVRYAHLHGLQWREDSTNHDTAYRRNAIRQQLRKLTPGQRQRLLTHVHTLRRVNAEIDALLANNLHVQPALDALHRPYFVRLPHAVARELVATWLRRAGVRDFDRKGLERMVIAAKTYPRYSKIDVNHTYYIAVRGHTLALVVRDR